MDSARVATDLEILIPCQTMDALERFAAGETDAFENIFRQYQRDVYGWIVRIVRDPAAAEDLTIETFWRVYQSRRRFDSGRPFGPWVRRIASRLAIDYLRSERRSYANEVAAPVRTATRDLRAEIELAFARLPVKLRAAATLALVEELPYAEIAAGLGISLSAVKMRVARAVARLRVSLEKMGIQP